jgi:hypothetical protein
MKSLFPCMVILLLVSGSFAAGCTGSSPGPASLPATPAQSFTDLSQIALTRADIPFTVAKEQSEARRPDQGDLNRFSATRGFVAGYSDEQTDSPTSTTILQTIVEYPPGNATLAAADLENHFRATDDPKTAVVWFPDPAIGEKSFALTMTEVSGSSPTNPFTTIVFAKSNILEIIVLGD